MGIIEALNAGAQPVPPVDALSNLLATGNPFKRPRATVRPANRATWYRIENSADAGTAEIYIYDEIGYWGTSAQQLVDELKTITATQIDLHINSPGGEVFDGIAIYNCLKAHPATVTTYVDGLAASAASFIAMAGDRIVTARNATMMIHDASGFCWGNAAEMRQLADLLDKMSDNIADIYAQRAGGTVADWRALMHAETWYTGAEAVTAGLADEMTDPDPEPADGMTNTWDLSIFNYSGREAAPAPDGVRGTAPASEAAVEPPPAPPTTPPPAPKPAATFNPAQFRAAVRRAVASTKEAVK